AQMRSEIYLRQGRTAAAHRALEETGAAPQPRLALLSRAWEDIPKQEVAPEFDGLLTYARAEASDIVGAERAAAPSSRDELRSLAAAREALNSANLLQSGLEPLLD
ncbi:MAG: hypothetical protein AAFV27_04645, partial [Pseudomonadota bacterium]